MRTTERRQLPDHAPKNFWSVTDCFTDAGSPVRCFVHRDYEIGMHAHEFYEVNVVIRGDGMHYLEGGGGFATTAGDVFVLPPNLKHGYSDSRGLDVIHLLLHPRFLRRHEMELRMLPGFVLLFQVEPMFRRETSFRYALRLTPPQLERARLINDWLAEESALNWEGRNLVVESQALGLLAFFCRCYSDQHPGGTEARGGSHPQTEAMNRAFQLIARRFHEKLSLNDLAAVAHMERTHFCRVFHRITGQPPMEYVSRYRVQVATRMLRETDLRVSDIGQQLGFCDTAHFCRVFKRFAGCRPAAFRRG